MSYLTWVKLDEKKHVTLLDRVAGNHPVKTIYNMKGNKTIFIGGRGKHNTAGDNKGIPVEGESSIDFISNPPMTNQTSIYSEELGKTIALHLYSWGDKNV